MCVCVCVELRPSRIKRQLQIRGPWGVDASKDVSSLLNNSRLLTSWWRDSGRDKTDFVAHVASSSRWKVFVSQNNEVSTRHVITWPITRLHVPTVTFRLCHSDMEFPILRSVNACAYQPDGTAGYSPMLTKGQNNVFNGLKARGVCDIEFLEVD